MIACNRVYVTQAVVGFLGLLIAPSSASAKSGFVSLACATRSTCCRHCSIELNGATLDWRDAITINRELT